MDPYDLDSLRQLASEHHERRRHEADAARLARELRGTSQVMQPEPRWVATSLGLDWSTIEWLEARGLLSRLALTEQQVRTRLYYAHLAFLLTGSEMANLGLRAPARCVRPANSAPLNEWIYPDDVQ